MRGAECPRSSVPQQGIVTEAVNSVSQVGDVGGVRGDIGGVGCHGIVSGFELRAVNRVGAASRQVASGDVGDFAGGISTVCGAECPRCSVPQQGIVTEAVNCVSQVGDVGGIRGDIGGVGCHGIVSGFQLRAVYRVSATSRQVTVFDVGDFAGGIGAVRGAERGAIPQQGIVFKVANGIRQVGDVGGVGCHIIVSGFELRAVNRVGAASRQVTVFDVGDFAGGIGAVRGAERGAIPQQGIVFKVANGIRQVGDVGGVGCHIIVSGFELRAVNRVGAASRQVTVFDVGDFAGGIGAVRGAERGAIPQQGIVFKVANGIRQGIDTVSVGGDIGSIGRYVIVGGFQLRTVNRILTGIRNSAVFNVGDGTGSICTMCRTICLFKGVPL